MAQSCHHNMLWRKRAENSVHKLTIYLFFPQNEVRAVACWQSSTAYFINPSSLLLLTSGALAENCGFESAV